MSSKKITAKQIETERYVDEFTFLRNYPPTYKDIQDHFGISACAAHARCRNFRHKMKSHKTRPSAKELKVSLTYHVPADKFQQFSAILKQLNNLIANDES